MLQDGRPGLVPDRLPVHRAKSFPVDSLEADLEDRYSYLRNLSYCAISILYPWLYRDIMCHGVLLSR
jgi:hypothetical protein